MEGITIIIIALALAIFAVLYFRLRADYKVAECAYEAQSKYSRDKNNEIARLTAQLDQLSKDYKALEEKYNRYHRKQGKDGRFVKKGGEQCQQ